MYRGRPPPRGGYPPPFQGRGPPPPRPYPAPGYRDDRNRPKPQPPYHAGYHDHSHTDSHRRSPPRRRYPSPGSGSLRGGEHWSGGPPRESSPPSRGPIPLDHNLVITVGNELTGPPGLAPSSRHHDRDYHLRPEYERGRTPDRSRAKSLGRSKSRPRSHSRSPDRGRAKSRGRSKSRVRSKSRSPDQSRGRSKSRSPDRSRAKSRGRSKSRHHSRSRSQSRSRSRGRSRGRSYSKAANHARSKSRHRSHSRSQSRSRSCSVSSSSSSRSNSANKSKKEFKELQMARRRKELEEMLSLPTKSILKKRNGSEDSPSVRNLDSPSGLEGSNISRVADQLLQAVKGMEPDMVAAVLSELQSDPQMAHRPGLNSEIKEILNLLGGTGSKASIKTVDDIDDEERYLYGDSEESKPPPVAEPVRNHGLDLYSDVTEDTLYGDYPPPNPVVSQTYGLPRGTAPHLQAPPNRGEVDMQYESRPTISAGQNITVQVSNPAYPPGTEPLEESERQALEEYEKIQDLLKTIGLDLGVVEISKMAARTKERLHGNKPPPKTPSRRRRYSSGSSNGSCRGRRRRSSSSSSSISSRSRSHGRGGSWSSDDGPRKSAPPRSHKERDVKEMKTDRSEAALLPQTPDPSTLTPSQGVPIPTYPPSQVPSILPPNYPPPGYNQYGNYLPYMHQQWPPMYPPPSMNLPPRVGPEEFPPTLPYKQSYNKIAPELGVKASLKSLVQDVEKGSLKLSSHEQRVSEEQNNESQKQKVLEEREKLKQERDIRMKKKEYLMKELERLRKQQGELLRKKRREKDGHKDPLLQEISHLQEEVMSQISNLRKEHEAAEKKRSEIEKVALILGLSPSDRPRRTSKQAEEREEEFHPPPEKKKREPELSPESQQRSSGSTLKESSAAPSSSRASTDKTPVPSPAPLPNPIPEPFEYYDAGNHWCRNCNVTSGSMFDFFTHLHSKTHRKTLDLYNRPWASTATKIIKNIPSEEKLTKPAKGSEFLVPIRGFFCLLCKEFYGDAICAEEHVTTHAHNEKYKKQIYENPLYEQRRNLDRQAGLALEASGKKRKHEDDEKGSKDKEEKNKHKKEKKDKEKKKEADASAQMEESEVKKVEEEEKLKPGKKEEPFKIVKGQEEERPHYSKKDEDDKYKYSKKDDKYRYSRDEEERGKYSRRDEDDRYSRDEEHRYRYRRDYHERYDDRAKCGPRDDEDRYKYSKYSDSRSKYDRDQNEVKSKTEKETFNTTEPGKPEVGKPEPPPKPYDPSKIICGPSPAMRAKLRKQSLEAGKPAPVTTTTSFGKFMWKKKENLLAKEAEKVAAEFIKDDEAAASQQEPVSVEDSFAKSMAVAKEIAEKLAGQNTLPPPWVSSSANRGRIRPNLPAPAVVLRRTTMTGKPASLNTFLSIRPQNTGLLDPPPKDDPLFPDPLTKALNAQKALLETKPVPPDGPLETPAASKPEFYEAKSPSLVTGPAPVQVKPVPPVFKLETKSGLAEINPAPLVSKPDPVERKPAPSDVKSTQSTLVKIVSDVAAPGVPESEQTRTVFVKPPPFMNMGDGSQKSEKLKSNLAAAKAQDLFGIFYSSISQPGPPSITKPAANSRGNGSSAKKSPPPTPQPPKPQRQPQPQGQSQISIELHTSPQPNLNSSTSNSQFQPPSEGHKPDSTNSLPSTQNQCRHPTQVHISPQPDSSKSAQKKQSQSKLLNEDHTSPPLDSNVSPPSAQIQAPPPAEVRKPSTNQSPPSIQIQTQSPATVHISPQPDSKNTPSPSPQSNPKSGIQITSVWSLQPTQASAPVIAPSKTTLHTTPKTESHITSQTRPAEEEPKCHTQSQNSSQIPEVLQCEPQPSQDTQPHSQLEHYPETAPEPQPKPGPKTRGKTTPAKKTPPAPCPVRQTRYQTRRRQQQSQPEPEPELASGHSDSAVSDPKGLDTSDPRSGLQPEVGGPCEEEHQVEVTPETLGLPSDMTSLDFEYDFNFE
ncbi:zinc finger protein 318 isoform X2 [Anabas testudineus]|uniref:zinc finger protein 318 isoform X2 n=1 Tax=Anabas testudineus TaxID=64144 RepID=UPI000E4636A4|nr:zinc finger protein 318 isoform X2 [Anabas testudineus]